MHHVNSTWRIDGDITGTGADFVVSALPLRWSGPASEFLVVVHVVRAGRHPELPRRSRVASRCRADRTSERSVGRMPEKRHLKRRQVSPCSCDGESLPSRRHPSQTGMAVIYVHIANGSTRAATIPRRIQSITREESRWRRPPR